MASEARSSPHEPCLEAEALVLSDKLCLSEVRRFRLEILGRILEENLNAAKRDQALAKPKDSSECEEGLSAY